MAAQVPPRNSEVCRKRGCAGGKERRSKRSGAMKFCQVPDQLRHQDQTIPFVISLSNSFQSSFEQVAQKEPNYRFSFSR